MPISPDGVWRDRWD